MKDWFPYLFNPETHCNQPFIKNHSPNFRDHDYVTGQYRGAAQKWCIIGLRRTCKILVFFDNFRRYDADFITMTLKDIDGVEIRVIGDGMLELSHNRRVKYLV